MLLAKLRSKRWGSLPGVPEQQACYLGSYPRMIRDMQACNKSSLTTEEARAWLLNHPAELSPMLQVTSCTEALPASAMDVPTCIIFLSRVTVSYHLNFA